MSEHDVPLHDETLRQTARRLGAGAAERLDVDATAARVTERLMRESHAVGWAWTRAGWLHIAAAVIVLLGGALGVLNRLVPERAPAAIAVAAELYGLSATELEELLATLDQTLDLDAPLPGAEDGLDELSEDQLRTVLEILEG